MLFQYANDSIKKKNKKKQERDNFAYSFSKLRALKWTENIQEKTRVQLFFDDKYI